MRRILVIFTILIAFLPGQLIANELTLTSYRLGIFPYMAPRQTVEFYGPVAANIEAALKHPVRLESVQSFSAFSRAMEKRTYDIALIQPFDYPNVVDKHGYIPIAQLAVPLVTQFFVRADSKFKKIEDLRDSLIAMPPQLAANSRMAVRALYDNNLIPGKDVKVRYFNSHDSCIQQVWTGLASACATAMPPILIFEKRMQASLRPIYDTPPIPHVLFVVSPDLSLEQRQKLQELMIGWSQSAKGKNLLKNLGFPGFVAAKPAAYKVMKNYDPIADAMKASPGAGKDLMLGVFPFLGARQLAQNFAPILPMLTQSTGSKVHLRTAVNFASFTEGLNSETFDIMFIQPFDYATASKHGYIALAGMSDQAQGTFFVLKQSPYQKITDFKGKVVAMPPQNSVMAYLGREALKKAGLEPGNNVTLDYRQTHDSCLMQVQRHKAEACISAFIIPGMLPTKITHGLRKVGKTDVLPGVLFMAHKRINRKIRRQLKKNIISLKNNAEGRKILKSIHLGNFSEIDVREYENFSSYK